MAKTPKPLRRDAQRNRERILAAARDVFAERGVEATLDDVAAAAGVGVGTVYRRYANKDALLDELLEQGIDELAAFVERSLADRDAWGAFVRFVEHLADRFAANRALEDLLLRTEHGRRRVAAARERLAGPIAALVERAKAEGGLRPDFEPADVGTVYRMLASLVHEPGDLQRSLGFLLQGLAARDMSR